jgi:hypothetical protein
VLPLVPVELFVKVTADPMHTLRGEPVKSAFRLHPARVIGKVFVAPSHRAAVRSVTVMFPFVVPKLTVIVLLSGPAPPLVIVAPAGTVHV